MPYDQIALRKLKAGDYMFKGLKVWQHVATRYCKLKTTYAASTHIADIVMLWFSAPSLTWDSIQMLGDIDRRIG